MGRLAEAKVGGASAAAVPTVRFITLGCAKNEADTDAMKARVLEAGFAVADDESADVVIINTCSFITDATQESVDTIFELVDERIAAADGHCGAAVLASAKIVVTGCMPSRYGAELSQEIPEVDLFLPIKEQPRIAEVVAELVGASVGIPALDQRIFRTADAPYAYVKISDGCSRFCSFCTIPFIRGPYASRIASEIVDEVAFLVAGGVREIILIGQDTGIWGTDLEAPELYAPLAQPTLAELLDHIAALFPQTWIRVMYLQPEGINDRLLSVIAARSNICNYLDIPLQHASAKVISEMNRTGSGSAYLATVRHIRESFDDIMVRTTLIAGFPGETEEEFEELLDFVEEAEFDFAGVFGYSQEEGTVAGDRDDQVDDDEIATRAQTLTDAAERIGFARIRRRIGSLCEVLVCGIVDDDELEFDGTLGTRKSADDGQHSRMWGRASFQAPDVDGIITFDAADCSVGDIVTVEIVDSVGYDLEGVVRGET
ncbi:MAG: 30S ribosomal protein S12 methylthiotransferase RimO [bacterium]|nr:30S ribosomal protein S12 methylthiotransferase RimO [bacterium]